MWRELGGAVRETALRVRAAGLLRFILWWRPSEAHVDAALKLAEGKVPGERVWGHALTLSTRLLKGVMVRR